MTNCEGCLWASTLSPQRASGKICLATVRIEPTTLVQCSVVRPVEICDVWKLDLVHFKNIQRNYECSQD